MGIILKFVIKNIKEKRVRTFLIIFAITLSASLFYASSSISGNLVNIYTERLTQLVGTADILVSPDKTSPSGFLNPKLAHKLNDKTDYIIGAIQVTGFYRASVKQDVAITLTGIDLSRQEIINPLVLLQQKELEPFERAKIIISEKTAQRYKLQLGDTLRVFIGDVERRFVVSAIAAAKGVFLDESQGSTAIVPYNILAQYTDAVGKSNLLYIKANEQYDKKQLLKELQDVYKKYSVREAFTKEEFEIQISRIATPLMLMTIVVALMSIFIIYSSFKVITIERLPIIGTFRSIGATRRMTNTVLIAESLFYGAVGGILACFLGVAILYIISSMSLPESLKGIVNIRLEFDILKLLITFLLANFLCFISCIAPIFKISKIPVKDIVLNNVNLKQEIKRRKMFVWLGVVALAFFLPRTVASGVLMPVSIVCLLMSNFSVIQLIPYLTDYFVMLFSRTYSLLFGNIGIIAIKNIRGNKSVLNSISLIAIGISSLLMISTVSSSVSSEVINFYKNTAAFDVMLQMEEADKNLVQVIRKSEGVKDVFPVYMAQKVQIQDNNSIVNVIESVDRYKYLDYWHVTLSDNSDKLFERLDAGRNIIISNTLRDKCGVKENDELILKMPSGYKTYKIVGFVNTLLYDGSYALMSEKYLKADTNSNFYSTIYIKNYGDSELVAKELNDKFSKRHPQIQARSQIERINVESNQQIFSMLTGFSALALLIGIIGVLNNLIISFLERRYSLAMFRSIGMSKKQIIKMIFIESLTAGLLGGIFGVLAGTLMIAIVPFVMDAIKLSMPVYYMPEIYCYYMIGGIFITVISSIVPAIKSSKLNIIESIKYE